MSILCTNPVCHCVCQHAKHNLYSLVGFRSLAHKMLNYNDLISALFRTGGAIQVSLNMKVLGFSCSSEDVKLRKCGQVSSIHRFSLNSST